MTENFLRAPQGLFRLVDRGAPGLRDRVVKDFTTLKLARAFLISDQGRGVLKPVVYNDQGEVV